MQRIAHPLLSNSLGSHKTLTSFHFGSKGSFPKIYLQASLHAEELPGMLVAHHLRALLEAADAAGQLRGEIVLVPVANPIGLAQRLNHKAMGRFELDSAQNFNRHYPDLAKSIEPGLRDALGQDAQANVALVRQAIGGYLPFSQVYAFEPVPANLDAQFRFHIIGAQANLWTEYVPSLQHAEYMTLPRLCALAEVAWSPASSRNYGDFMRRLQVQARRFDQLGVNYRRASIQPRDVSH